MSAQKYRVIQWATGTVGKAALKYFIENPALELAGVYVTSAEKNGKDAGDLAGLPKTGVIASNDAEAMLAQPADCILYAGLPLGETTLNLICRMLASGRNVISTAGPFLPNKWFPEETAKIEAACKTGNSSFHGCGIHPGFSGDLLPLTLTRLMNRVDCIEVSEVIDKLRNPMIYTEMMGFGADPDELLAKPRRSPDTYKYFYSSMAMIAAGLGKEIENVTVKFEVSKATRDITHDYGIVKKGMVGGQHYEWTAWVEGAPLIVYHFYWQLGTDLDPFWDQGEDRYRVVIKGDPGMECSIMGAKGEDGRRPFLGLPWTGLMGCTVVPQICEAKPGIVSHLDLGVVQPRGLVRR